MKIYTFNQKRITLKIATLLSISCLLLLYGRLKAQTQFYKSDINFTDKQLQSFSSAIAADENRVYFIANDYALYCLDKKNATIGWKTDLNWKISTAPYILGDTLFTGHYDWEYTSAAMIDTKTGSLIKRLPFEPLHTAPHLKNGILYCTTIYNAGNILGYDIKNDSVLWDRFIAHGVSTQPVYLEDKIIANAEDTNWFELDYKNKLLGTCNNPAGFVEDITCVKNYRFLSHDHKEITDNFIEKYFGTEQYSFDKYFTQDNTFIMSSENLVVLSKKLKVLTNISLYYEEVDDQYSSYFKILYANDKHVWCMSNNMILQYELKGQEPVKYNLAQWNPHCAVLEGNVVWLINRNDGQLYGLTLE
jgi:hypothetical protein